MESRPPGALIYARLLRTLAQLSAAQLSPTQPNSTQLNSTRTESDSMQRKRNLHAAQIDLCQSKPKRAGDSASQSRPRHASLGPTSGPNFAPAVGPPVRLPGNRLAACNSISIPSRAGLWAPQGGRRATGLVAASSSLIFGCDRNCCLRPLIPAGGATQISGRRARAHTEQHLLACLPACLPACLLACLLAPLWRSSGAPELRMLRVATFAGPTGASPAG